MTIETKIYKHTIKGGTTMDIHELEQNHPDLYNQIFEEGKQRVMDEKVKEAVSAETKRILDLAEVVLGKERSSQFAGLAAEPGINASMITKMTEFFRNPVNKK
jgi:hypothetical protein